jgi:hypothetical protein
MIAPFLWLMSPVFGAITKSVAWSQPTRILKDGPPYLMDFQKIFLGLFP